jgi:hypothetical protein
MPTNGAPVPAGDNRAVVGAAGQAPQQYLRANIVFDNYDTVDVIWHYHERVQIYLST